MVNPLWTFDRKRSKGFSGIIGVDEAGRGCLAGPVVAGAVLLPGGFFQKAKNRKVCLEVNDSKQIKEQKREELFEQIIKLAEAGELFWAAGHSSVEEIESENIVGATCLAMKRAMEQVSKLSKDIWKPISKKEDDLFSEEICSEKNVWIVSVDGRLMKKLPYQHEGLIKGDTFSLAIAMGSIVAKVIRDRLMRKLALEFEGYDFSSNKGYGSPKHLAGLHKNGPCVHHRPKFLRNLLNVGTDKKTIEEDKQSQLSFS
jgi:ribonuclease HII